MRVDDAASSICQALPGDVMIALVRQHPPPPGRPHTARHVIGCHVTQETRVQTAFCVDDVASNIISARPYLGMSYE